MGEHASQHDQLFRSVGQERSAVNGSPGGRLKSEMEMVYYATRELAKRTEQQQDSWLDSFTAKLIRDGKATHHELKDRQARRLSRRHSKL